MKRQVPIVKWLGLILILVAILISSVACWGDLVLGVNGCVYEWIDSPPDATSKIYIVSINDIEESSAELENILASISENTSVLPLKDAEVVLGRKKDVDREGEQGYRFKVDVDVDGKFKEGWTLPPTKEDFLIKLTKQGYMEVVGEFENSGRAFGHGILAILVKKEQGN